MSHQPKEHSSTELIILTSPRCIVEKTYIFDWVFHEVLGINFEVRWDGATTAVEISDPQTTCKLVFQDRFFAAADQDWLSTQSLPTTVSMTDNNSSDQLPIPVFDFGSSDNQTVPRNGLFETTEPTATQHHFPFDLFGSIFFLLSRYEEAVVATRDEHDRFPSSASVLTKFNLLERPIGNEYIELLWRNMKKLWPSLERKERNFHVLPSHDIDVPSAYWRSSVDVVRTSLGAIRKGKLTNGLSTLKDSYRYWKKTRDRNWEFDPNDTIDWIMDQSEQHNLKSAFYYIPEKTHRLDPGMPIDHPHVVDQWRRIASRGHEIGFHPGYDTYLSPERIKRGALQIQQQLEKLGIKQEVLGGRQHFLRWKSPETAIHWDDAGLDYDSSLGFADRCGFRCGVCYEFPMYDLVNRRELRLRQRPLVVMECTVTDERYMGLGTGEKAFEHMNQLKNQCRKYNGDFTILWHNQRFRDESDRSLYRRLLSS